MMFDKEEILLKATGMWPVMLQNLTGLPTSVFSKKHQACPMCGGKDRFRFDDKLMHKGDGGYICSQCGSGDGLALYMQSTCIDFKTAMQNLGNYLNMIPVEKINIVRKQIAAQASLPKYTESYHEDAEKLLMSCSETEKTPPFFVTRSEHIVKCKTLNDYDAVFKMITANGQLVNLLIVDPYGDASFAGESITAGSFVCLGQNTEKWIVCHDITDALIIHEQTGLRTICTVTQMNTDAVLIALANQSKRLLMACNVGDVDALYDAEKFDIKVVLPITNNQLSDGGIERKAYHAGVLIDEWSSVAA